MISSHRDTLYGRRKDVQVSRHFLLSFLHNIEQNAGDSRWSLPRFSAEISCQFPMVGPNKLRSNAHWVRSNAGIYIYVYGIPTYTQRFTVCLILDETLPPDSLKASRPQQYPAQIFHSFFIHLFHSTKLVKADWVKESYLQPWSPKLNARAGD